MPTLPRLDQFDDFTLLGPQDIEDLNRRGSDAFIESNAEYYPSQYNSMALMKWCNDRTVPFTRKNLEIAYREMQAAGLVELRPTPAPLVRRKIRTGPTEPERVDDPSLTDPEPQREFADDPALTDRERKDRDEKLRRAAVAQRRRFPRGEPSIVI